MKKSFTKIIFTFAIFFTFIALANAQNIEKYTYRDLLIQQKIERDELKQTQKEILDKVIARQKEEVELVRGNSGPTMTLMVEQREERGKIIQLQTSEREKQMQIQAEERKNFKPY